MKNSFITARVYDNKAASILVKVPVIMGTIPEVPDVILIGKDEIKSVAVIISTNPLSYRVATFGRAKKIK
jgi:hypothetical protein